MDVFSVLTLIGGLALFLYGMDAMGDGLKKYSGSRLEGILNKLTSNQIKGFFLGLGVTALIQSSSATIVMLVGFVNSGIMKLSQTIGIIMGANIGTTVTAWLLSTSEINGASLILKLLKPTSFTPIIAAVGVLINMTAKNEKRKSLSQILIGFAVLMFGMEMMGGSMDGLKENQSFQNMLIMFSNPVVGILLGTVVTAVIQSSSASVGMLQALALTGAIPYETAIPIILGMNIGATMPPILSAINGNTESKRVAAACLYIKIIGVVIVAAVFYLINAFKEFEFMGMPVSPVTIAVIHTLFNILSTIILIPFCKQISNLSILTIKGKKSKTDIFDTLDERFLTVPTFAVEKCHQMTNDMTEIARDSFKVATSMIFNYDKSREREILENEKIVDKYEDKIGSYLVKLAGAKINENDSQRVTQLLHVIGDIERISDHSVNVLETAQEIREKNIDFSNEAKREIEIFTEAVNEILSLASKSLIDNDIEAAKYVEPLEQTIDNLRNIIKTNHIKRLQDGFCTMEHGFVLSDLLTNYERVADHCSNLAVSVLNLADNSFESHEYMKHVKKDGENEFFDKFNEYSKKYSI